MVRYKKFVLKESAIINKKLIENLAIGRIIEITKSIPIFISSSLRLVSKYNRY